MTKSGSLHRIVYVFFICSGREFFPHWWSLLPPNTTMYWESNATRSQLHRLNQQAWSGQASQVLFETKTKATRIDHFMHLNWGPCSCFLVAMSSRDQLIWCTKWTGRDQSAVLPADFSPPPGAFGAWADSCIPVPAYLGTFSSGFPLALSFAACTPAVRRKIFRQRAAENLARKSEWRQYPSAHRRCNCD